MHRQMTGLRPSTQIVQSPERYATRIAGRSISGGNTCHVPLSCRKKYTANAPAGRETSTHTYRLRFEGIRPNRVTRAGITRVGPSHFSTSKRKGVCSVLIDFSFNFTCPTKRPYAKYLGLLITFHRKIDSLSTDNVQSASGFISSKPQPHRATMAREASLSSRSSFNGMGKRRAVHPKRRQLDRLHDLGIAPTATQIAG